MGQLAAKWTHSANVQYITLPALGGAQSMLLEFRGCTVSVGSTVEFFRAGNPGGATINVEDPTAGGTTSPAICVSSLGGIFKARVVAGGGGHFTGGTILMWNVSEPYHTPGIHTADTSRARADTTIFTADRT